MRGGGVPGRGGPPKPNSQHGAAGAEPPQDVPGIQKEVFQDKQGLGVQGSQLASSPRGCQGHGEGTLCPPAPSQPRLPCRRSWGWASHSHPTEPPSLPALPCRRLPLQRPSSSYVACGRVSSSGLAAGSCGEALGWVCEKSAVTLQWLPSSIPTFLWGNTTYTCVGP